MSNSGLASGSQRSATSYKPFSLQHWALIAVVKDSIKSATPPLYRNVVKFDIPLFDDLKVLHQRGLQLLNYELSFASISFSFRSPLSRLIFSWEKRFQQGVFSTADPAFYVWSLVENIDTLKPSCSCRVSWADKKTALPSEDNHKIDCDGYMPGKCAQCTKRWIYEDISSYWSENKSCYGHIDECYETQ